MQEQTRRHAYLLHLLGIHQIVVAINKMDLVGYAESRFQELITGVQYFADLGLDLQHSVMIPVVARDGDNIVAGSEHMRWYEGPALAEALDQLQPPLTSLDLLRASPCRTSISSTIDASSPVGSRAATSARVHLCCFPINKKARIASIEAWNAKAPVIAARAGQSVGVTLDEQIFVERGEIASRESIRRC